MRFEALVLHVVGNVNMTSLKLSLIQWQYNVRGKIDSYSRATLLSLKFIEKLILAVQIFISFLTLSRFSMKFFSSSYF